MKMILAWTIYAAVQCMNVNAPDSTCFVRHGPQGIVAQVCQRNPEWEPVEQHTNDIRKIIKGKRGTLIVLPHDRCKVI